jgi:inhibitor of cysteine peptidase
MRNLYRPGSREPVGIGQGMDIMRARRPQFAAAGTRFTLFVMAAILCASLISCSRSSNSMPAGTTNVTDADNEHAVILAVGDTLVVSLAATPGTGFGWKVMELDGKMLRAVGTPEVIPNAHPMPGAPATQVFHFQAVGAGSTGLELDYVRPWEKSAAPAHTFHLGVTVR